MAEASDADADPGVPPLPPAPSPSPAPSRTFAPSLPPRSPAPSPTPTGIAAPFAAAADPGAGPMVLPADRAATRNVPTARGQPLDLGLPSAPATPLDAMADPSRSGFVRPDLVPLGDATAALLVGRVLFALAALLIGVAARRSTGTGEGQFWPVVWSAAVFTAVGVVGLVFWSAQLADNARRLRCRSATPRSMVVGWSAVVAWVVLSSSTFLRIEVEGELDPLPAVAAVGWIILLAVAYGQLQGVFRALSRTPPVVWITAFPIDVVAFGLVWWRLTGWPSPIGGDGDAVRLTSNVAFGAAAASTLNVLVFVRLARRGRDGLHERIGRLEARVRQQRSGGPA